jgi:hypothetical protein
MRLLSFIARQKGEHLETNIHLYLKPFHLLVYHHFPYHSLAIFGDNVSMFRSHPNIISSRRNTLGQFFYHV